MVIGMVERKLRKMDALFASPEHLLPDPGKRRLAFVPHDMIDPHPSHCFRPYDPEANPGLLDSICAMGVLQPVLLQASSEGRYILLSGYKRLYCNAEAGNREILALIDEDVPEAAAKLIVTQTNTTQYGMKNLLPSELAYALKMELEAFTELRHQLRKRKAQNKVCQMEHLEKIEVGDKVYHVAHLEKSRDSLAKAYGMKPTEVQRLIQLTDLIPTLLELVDQKKLAMRPAVILSTLPKEAQKEVFSAIRGGCTITTHKAQALKSAYESDSLSSEDVRTLLSDPIPVEKYSPVSLRSAVVKKYFSPDSSPGEIQDTIEKALQMYFSQNKLSK